MQGDEFQAEVFGGGGWWNYPSRSLLFGSSPCGSGIISEFGGGFGYWSSSSPHELLDMMKTRSCGDGDGDGDDEYYSGGGGGGGSAASDGSVVIHKPNQNQPDSASGGLSMDSGSLKIMGNIGISSSSSSSSSSTTDWINNPANFLQNGSNGTILEQQHRNSSMNNYGQSDGGGGEIQKDMMSWVDNLNNFSTLIPHNDDHQDFPLNSSSSSSYGINYSSTTAYNSPPPPHDQPQTQSLFGNYQRNLNQFLPNSNLANKFSPLTNSSSSSSLPPAAAAAVLNDFRPTNLFATTQSHLLSSTFNDKTYTTTLPNLSTAKGSNEEVTLGNLGSVAKKNSSSELPAFKRPRIETPSPLPTFKVRKEKLGDRITALQQLVSPFGKTDTASVLHEAIEYIKFLHDQVNVLSTPYMRNGSPIQRQQSGDIKKRDQQGGKQDLRSRGLCLVPISSTFPVAAETTTDFWTPTFGATFR